MTPEAWVRHFKKPLQYLWVVAPPKALHVVGNRDPGYRRIAGPIYTMAGLEEEKPYYHNCITFESIAHVTKNPGEIDVSPYHLPMLPYRDSINTKNDCWDAGDGWQVAGWKFEKDFKTACVRNPLVAPDGKHVRSLLEVLPPLTTMRSWIPGCTMEDLAFWVAAMEDRRHVDSREKLMGRLFVAASADEIIGEWVFKSLEKANSSRAAGEIFA